MTKTCTKCNETKSATEFHRMKKGKYGRNSVCKACKQSTHQETYEYRAEYWQQPENKARKKENARKFYLKNKEKINKRSRVARLKRDFRMTVEDYDRMLLTQNGRCKICGRMPNKKRLHIDHDHETSAVRGLLCQQCNHMIGLAGDKPMILRLAALYLEGVES